MSKPRHGRTVVAAGARTPFTRAFEELIGMDSIALAGATVGGLLERTKLDPRELDEVVWGSVVVKSAAPNIAREVVLEKNLPRHIHGVMVSRACLSGLEAVTRGAYAIERGDASCVLAGGSDSTSHAEMPLPPALVQLLAKLSMGGGPTAQKLLKALAEVKSFADLLPKAPQIAERATGKTMGRHADEMAERFAIARERQEALAIRSHARAAAAQAAGIFDAEIVPVTPPGKKPVTKDTLIRASIDPEKLKKLKPAFRKQGSITAATSSALTDGGAAVLLMSEAKAQVLGFPADVVVKDWVYTALDPFDALLLGPALAVPKLLDKCDLTLDDIDLFEVHEAFAAQVLCVLDALKDPAFCKARLGKEAAVGEVPDEKLNVSGGSVALGHPFAATGGRLVLQAANELRRRKARYAVITICAAGGMGGAALLERVG